MAYTDNSSFRTTLIPNFLYNTASSSSSFSSYTNTCESSIVKKPFLVPAPKESSGKIEMFSPAYYAACTFGGVMSCGLTHMAVTPLDLVKCNMQVPLFYVWSYYMYTFFFSCSWFELSLKAMYSFELTESVLDPHLPFSMLNFTPMFKIKITSLIVLEHE